MTRTPTAVFKCKQPSLVDEYDQRTTVLWDEYRAKAKILQEELGVETLACNSGWGDTRITGYVEDDRSAKPKPGFRKDSGTGFMKPALRTKEGKAIAERLKDVRYIPGKKPGLPSVVMGEGFMGPFSLQKLEGTWYAVLTVPLGSPEDRAKSLSEVDRSIWEPAKLSEYFLAAESAEDLNQ